jgi:unsaturated chondroitin disaccharide hydrolase
MHDVGFMINNSYGHGYRLTQDTLYRAGLLRAAKSLCTRFNPAVGCIKSWDGHEQWPFPVIIDNMMNLELLFNAFKISGDSLFYRIAISHANTTLKNHFRADYSSYHVVAYDPHSGAVLSKVTHQGYSDQSAWARGQSWGLYGFTMCHRETKNSQYLEQARHIANFLLHHAHLPADKVPYWDYDAPAIPNEPRDASAAAILCSALYELCSFCTPAESTAFKQAADQILAALSSRSYRTPAGKLNLFLLQHSVGSKPGNVEVDVPLIYADYYFLEANLRKLKLEPGG